MLFRSAVASPGIADFVFNNYAGSNMMVIKNSNVGIGTNNPGGNLEVAYKSASSLADGTIRIGNYSTTSTYGDNIYSLRWSSQLGMGPYSTAKGIWSRQGIALHVDANEEYSVKSSGWSNLFGVKGGSGDVYVSGNVGIGTTNPLFPLHISGSAQSIFNQGNRGWIYYGGTATNSTGYGSWNTSIYTTHSIITGDWLISHQGSLYSSDSRIKKNIVDADDSECLETLRLLKPKKYQYKDEINRGQEPVWGFIAQEVRETLPYATQLRQDVLPNIYELANVSSSNVITFTNFNTSNLESNATTLIRTKGIDGKDHDIHLVEVVDEHTIRVEEDLTEWIGSVDETGNVVAGNQLFVYGQEIDDFVFLKKEAIWTVATAALQEVDRIQQQHDAQIADLEAAVTSRDQQIDELRSELSDIVSRLEAVESG